MLSLFPGILFLSPLSFTLLRVAAALCFFYMAWRLMERREAITHIWLHIVGNPRQWMVWTSALANVVVGGLLLIGLWTQAVAIVGMLIAFKHFLGTRAFSDIIPLSATANLLLMLICLCLLLSGAGAFAFDLPL